MRHLSLTVAVLLPRRSRAGVGAESAAEGGSLAGAASRGHLLRADDRDRREMAARSGERLRLRRRRRIFQLAAVHDPGRGRRPQRAVVSGPPAGPAAPRHRGEQRVHLSRHRGRDRGMERGGHQPGVQATPSLRRRIDHLEDPLVLPQGVLLAELSARRRQGRTRRVVDVRTPISRTSTSAKTLLGQHRPIRQSAGHGTRDPDPPSAMDLGVCIPYGVRSTRARVRT